MEQDQYFVPVRDSREVRTNILNTSKDLVQVLQRIETIKRLRVRKLERVADVKNTNKEIRLLINKLKRIIPATGLRVKNSREGKKKSKIRGNELAELEEELRMIEEKIGQLS